VAKSGGKGKGAAKPVDTGPGKAKNSNGKGANKGGKSGGSYADVVKPGDKDQQQQKGKGNGKGKGPAVAKPESVVVDDVPDKEDDPEAEGRRAKLDAINKSIQTLDNEGFDTTALRAQRDALSAQHKQLKTPDKQLSQSGAELRNLDAKKKKLQEQLEGTKVKRQEDLLAAAKAAAEATSEYTTEVASLEDKIKQVEEKLSKAKSYDQELKQKFPEEADKIDAKTGKAPSKSFEIDQTALKEQLKLAEDKLQSLDDAMGEGPEEGQEELKVQFQESIQSIKKLLVSGQKIQKAMAAKAQAAAAATTATPAVEAKTLGTGPPAGTHAPPVLDDQPDPKRRKQAEENYESVYGKGTLGGHEPKVREANLQAMEKSYVAIHNANIRGSRHEPYK